MRRRRLWLRAVRPRKRMLRKLFTAAFLVVALTLPGMAFGQTCIYRHSDTGRCRDGHWDSRATPDGGQYWRYQNGRWQHRPHWGRW